MMQSDKLLIAALVVTFVYACVLFIWKVRKEKHRNWWDGDRDDE